MSEFDHEHNDDGRGVSRRRVLECMTWAGTGVLWTVSGGVPRSLGLVGSARAAEPAGLTFLQISDSHVGFDKPANERSAPRVIGKINAMPVKPSFMIHRRYHPLSKVAEFGMPNASSRKPSSTCITCGRARFIDEEVKLYRERYGRGTRTGWYSFDANGVPSSASSTWWISRPAVSAIGTEQRIAGGRPQGRSKSTPIVVFAHIPCGRSIRPGVGHRGEPRALDYLRASAR
jgi:hypothetical protein